MVDVGSEKGAIDHEEKEFIQNVFEFDDLTAGDIATHRTMEGNDLWQPPYPLSGLRRDGRRRDRNFGCKGLFPVRG